MYKTNVGKPLPFEENENFRELGGYRNKDGKIVKGGVFFRSGMLGSIKSESDISLFNSLGIKAIIDFRSENEREYNPEPIFEGIKQIAQNAMLDENGNEVNFDMKAIFEENKWELAGMAKNGIKHYSLMPFNNNAYKLLFGFISKNEVPLLFHCTAGKDRTGVAAALILRALGVSDEVILEDYMLTNIYRDKTRAMFTERVAPTLKDKNISEIVQSVLGVEKKLLLSALNAIDEKYSDFSDYLEKECDFTKQMQQEMKAKYLVD